MRRHFYGMIWLKFDNKKISMNVTFIFQCISYGLSGRMAFNALKTLFLWQTNDRSTEIKTHNHPSQPIALYHISNNN